MSLRSQHLMKYHYIVYYFFVSAVVFLAAALVFSCIDINKEKRKGAILYSMTYVNVSLLDRCNA